MTNIIGYSNPFAVTSDAISRLKLIEQELLLELRSDRFRLKLKFNWNLINTVYPIITEKTIQMYLCELGVSVLTNIKNKKRQRLLSVEQEIRIC